MNQYFPKRYEPFGGDINVSCQIIQQKQILTMPHMLIL